MTLRPSVLCSPSSDLPPLSEWGEEAKAVKPETAFKARHWIVERTHSWMNRFRRVLIR
jgi:hypothetical protein